MKSAIVAFLLAAGALILGAAPAFADRDQFDWSRLGSASVMRP